MNAVPTVTCTACQEHQVDDQVTLEECVASYANSHDGQHASAGLGSQSQAEYWKAKLTLRMFSGLNAGLVILRKYFHSW